MRAFLMACGVSILIAIVAAVVLDNAVQKTSTSEFSTTAVRVD